MKNLNQLFYKIGAAFWILMTRLENALSISFPVLSSHFARSEGHRLSHHWGRDGPVKY